MALSTLGSHPARHHLHSFFQLWCKRLREDRLSVLAGHLAYWFAWDSYVGVASELYAPGR